MQNEYRLIALDMDGTLLNSRHEITPRAKRAIEKILARGKQVVFSTGRCIGEMETYLEAFPGMRYLICESGACVYDLQEKKNIARIPISYAKLFPALRMLISWLLFLWETVPLWMRPI